MSGASSKRQQARNERALQDLIKNVPGNNVCADCQARNPGWASWSLGIFICMRCAGAHRKLGTHITKVKSLSMDSWSTEQVENMKRVGNVASNRIYNPLNTRPPIPFDADEADSAMERFIKAKYQEKAASATIRHHTGSTNSDDHPPPLPPKTGSRFGFRSASSIFPLSSKAKREAAATARLEVRPASRDSTPSPPRRNKPSRVFGSAVGGDGSDDLDGKLTKLRDMGFRDEKRNSTVLKGLGGNLERSIETLVRLEGGGIARSTENSGPTSRSRAPISPGAGLSINRTRETAAPKARDDPFDMLDLPPPPAQPQSTQSTGSLAQPQMMANNPYQQVRSNPYGLQPSQSQYGLNQAFQNMSVSNPQPLFPNHTGGFPAPPQPFHQVHQQSMNPPVPSLPQQYYSPVIYENPSQQPQNHNPFMTQQQVRQAPPINTNFHSNPYSQPQQQMPASAPAGSYQSNPFMQQQQQQQQQATTPQSQSAVVQSSQASYYGNVPQQQQSQNPFFQTGQQQVPQESYHFQPQQPQAQSQYQQFQNPLPMIPQQTGRADKRSILDLYNYPQLAPTPIQQQQQQEQDQQQQSYQPAPSIAQQQPRSLSGSQSVQNLRTRNPFTTNGGGTAAQSQGEDVFGTMGTFPPPKAPSSGMARHMSQESVDVGGWQSGRHSPDAWGTISASVR